jgi:hypothetical protein
MLRFAYVHDRGLMLSKTLHIKLRDGAEPVRVSALKYTKPQLKFMRNSSGIEELRLVYKDSEAEWANTSLIFPKPQPDQISMTIGLRAPNASTKPTV